MSYSLLAYLYPRIKGSQEDVATYSLGYILEQSEVLNHAFTKLIARKLNVKLNEPLIYSCQDSDSKTGRPDIAGYMNGELKILCEAKFYAGLTEYQPSSYLKRLQKQTKEDGGLLFICPKSRIISLWDKLCILAEEHGLKGMCINDFCIDYSGITMSIVSWSEINAELMRVAIEQDPERQGDVKQLKGFCEKMDSEAFIPFRPEDFGPQKAREIDRYYDVIDETYKILIRNKSLAVDSKGLRKASSRQGYAQYLKINGIAVSIDYSQKLWVSPSSVETPFWMHIAEIVNGKWMYTDKIKRFMARVDGRMQDELYGHQYIALIPKPYVTLEELAELMASQVIEIIDSFNDYSI